MNHARHINRIARLAFKCEARTSEGLAIKAVALIAAANAGDQNLAHRSKLLYAESLARDVVRLAQGGTFK